MPRSDPAQRIVVPSIKRFPELVGKHALGKSPNNGFVTLICDHKFAPRGKRRQQVAMLQSSNKTGDYDTIPFFLPLSEGLDDVFVSLFHNLESSPNCRFRGDFMGQF